MPVRAVSTARSSVLEFISTNGSVSTVLPSSSSSSAVAAVIQAQPVSPTDISPIVTARRSVDRPATSKSAAPDMCNGKRCLSISPGRRNS